jgi:hypothetical protein
MALAGPRGEDQQHAGVLGRADLAALVRVELGEQAGAPADGLAVEVDDLDQSVYHDEPRALVDLVLVERLAGREAV